MKSKYDKLNSNKYEVHQLALGLIDDKSRVLDIGCATGCFAKELKKKKCVAWGVDKDKAAIKKAAKFCQRVVIGDLDDNHPLSAPKKYFDYVIILDVIEHLLHPEIILMAIKSHLKNDGRVIISVPNIAHASIRLMLLRGEFRYTSLGILDNTHVHFYTRSTFSDLLKNAGLLVQEILPTNGMCKVPLLYKISDRLPPSWQYWLVKKIPTLFSYQFIAVAKLK